jgi:UDP-N-acetylglucosamine diphosphorylase / glucose-1-phosphate thymidylyltransferase / UDP-N-acetylgalactosamine diphosphorylase / glucosamine-1-phosphate N-acetyltransferase / galactosamine-1-phosphate N-acetyltransferase
MRLLLCDCAREDRTGFYPAALSRPIWELRCGMTSLGAKIVAATGVTDVACFVPEYMAASHAARTAWPVNDAASLSGDDLLLVNPRLKAESLPAAEGTSEVGVGADGGVLYIRISQDEVAQLGASDLDSLVESATASLPNVTCEGPTWNYLWELVLESPDQITRDFAVAARSGIEGTVEQPNAIRGSDKDVYIAPGALVHPMVVIDAEHGPVYIDEDAEIHPFTRIEGPCYIGRQSILLGAKCREGNSIGPVCRVGGEVEESIIHGYSNKYHDGFLGHAYVGEWVNLGAFTTNSDLKNDYSSVSVTVEGGKPVDSGSTKVGMLIGDHSKTSIGTLFNTGAYVGAMTLILTTGVPLPKMIPSFSWLIGGVISKGFGRKKIYETAQTAMPRRGSEWTEADEAMWEAVYEMTAGPRMVAIKKGRKQIARRH